MSKKYFIIILLLFITSNVWATPAITSFSGTLTHGGSITISGSGFGTKSTAAPLKYDDFENGVNNETLANGWVVPTPQYVYPTYTTSKAAFSRSTKSVKNAFLNETTYEGQTVEVTAVNFGLNEVSLAKVYIDAWYYYEASSPYSRNHKLFRIHSEPNDTGVPNLYYQIYCAGVNAVLLQDLGTGNLPPDVWDAKVNTGAYNADYLVNKWSHIQAYFKESTPGNYDGTAEVWIDGNKIVNRINDFWNHGASDATGCDGGAECKWNKIWFGNFLSHAEALPCVAHPYDMYTYWDNVYVDNTPARVMLCNNAVFTNATICEPQIPLAWATDSITATVNLGVLTTETKYLFVCDSDNVCNSIGYAIAISGTFTGTEATGVITR